MVSPKVYFKYLRRALQKNHINGYAIDKKCDGKTCIYMDGGKWIVAEVKNGELVAETEYDEEFLWGACEDFITRLSKNEEQRKKTWMEWASPTNWAEKMNEPLVFRVISKDES